MVNRHDLDSNLPRTRKEILALNQAITYRLQDAFYLEDNKTIPIIPCIGNKKNPYNFNDYSLPSKFTIRTPVAKHLGQLFIRKQRCTST